MRCCNENHKHNMTCTPVDDYFHNDDTPHILDEEYYKDIMKQINPNWLPHNDYSHLI